MRGRDVAEEDIAVGKEVMVRAEGTRYPGFVVGIGKYKSIVYIHKYIIILKGNRDLMEKLEDKLNNIEDLPFDNVKNFIISGT